MSHIQIDTHPDERAANRNRPAEAMVMLNPISRRVIELWLEGLSNPQIAMTVGLFEEDVSKIGLQAIQQVRDVLAKSV